ncbi:hypothetical protein BDF22DRAFT_671230 [Syncephalis plumigaleata]|nr:hypothetical protein BDF22DRAFT_671230 [Syncephalis plumigaleata]
MASSIATTIASGTCYKSSTTESTMTRMDQSIRLEQQQELETLQTIFPDTLTYNYTEDIGYHGVLCIPIELDNDHPIAVEDQQTPSITNEVRHLPPIKLSFRLPYNYPYDTAPHLSLTCSWLSATAIAILQEQLEQEWSMVKDVILFRWADVIRDIPSSTLLTTPLTLTKACAEEVRAYNRQILQATFSRVLHACPICLEEIRGQKCYQLGCGHVCCIACLTDYFGLLIREGKLDAVKCPCPDHRSVYHPTYEELEQIVGPVLCARFYELKQRRGYEADPTVVWCPRPACQGPARCESQIVENTVQLAVCERCRFSFCTACQRGWHGAANHCALPKLEEDLQALMEEYINGDTHIQMGIEAQYGQDVIRKMARELLGDDPTVEEESAATSTQAQNQPASSVVEATKLAMPRVSRARARVISYRWIKNNTKRCPSCRTRIEKGAGCNHMTCSICRTEFCWLCLVKLEKSEVANHYDDKDSKCYRKRFTD